MGEFSLFSSTICPDFVGPNNWFGYLTYKVVYTPTTPVLLRRLLIEQSN